MLVLPAVLTLREARDTVRLLGQTLQAEDVKEPLVVDAGRLQRFDSAALAVLIELERQAATWGRGFGIRNASQKLTSLAKLYGVDRMLWSRENRDG